MPSRRTLTVLPAALLLVVALFATFGPAAPANAAGTATTSISAQAPASCPSGSMCIYPLTGWRTTAGWRHLPPTASGSCSWAGIATLGGIRGALSAYNRTGIVQRLWLNGNCTGAPSYYLSPGAAIDNLGSVRWSIGGP